MKKIISLILPAVAMSVALAAVLAACARPTESASGFTDREGNPITPPAKAERIVTMGPANTEIAVSLGLRDKLVAVDTYSVGLEGVSGDIPAFDMMQPDVERLIALTPDIVLVTGMSKADGVDMYKPLADTGVCVAFIPVSDSIDGIKEDILFLGTVTGAEAAAQKVVGEFEAAVERFHAVGDAAPEKQKVYFEIEAAPAMYSFGKGVFLDEMIGILGAENIFEDQISWIGVSEEAVLERDPDIIFTNVSYIDNAVGEIMSRSGWENITAVKQNRVYQISTNPSSLPDQYITIAFEEMAKALYD